MAIKVVKEKIKGNEFEFVYVKDVVAYYASVQEPKDKLNKPDPKDKNQSTREYVVTVFMSEEDSIELLDNIQINKQMFEVGKDKNKKRKIKYPLSSQVEEGKAHYDEVEGLFGVQFTLNELTNAGKKARLIVVDKKGKPFEELVGSGSRVTLKLFGYRNQEGLLNVRMNVVQVLEHVPYEQKEARIVDEEMGIDLGMDDLPEMTEDVSEDKPAQTSQPDIVDDFDDEDLF